MKKVLFIFVPVIISLLLCSCIVHSDNGAFEKHKKDFEIINDLMLSVESGEDDGYLLVFDEENTVTELYGFPYELDDSQLYSLNQIVDAFFMSFDYIEITENRISYKGEGNQMYVYSKDGKKPKYFHCKGDNISFSVEDLGDNWYYCFARIR